MERKEETPFVIDFKQTSNRNNYGTASPTSAPTPSTPLSPTGAMVSAFDSKGNASNEDDPNSSNNNNNAPLGGSSSSTYYLYGKNKVEVRDHCHYSRVEGVDVKARKKLIIASVLCLVFMFAEIVGGILSNSLAIATDAAHLLTDFASFMISLFAIWIAGRPSTQRMSFGWYRAEVIGALASVVMIWFITAILVWLAIQRLITREFEVDAEIMLITSGLAILVNLIMGFQLQHGHSHGSMVSHGHSHAKPKQKKAPKTSAKTPPAQEIADPTGLVPQSKGAGSTLSSPATSEILETVTTMKRPSGKEEDAYPNASAKLQGTTTATSTAATTAPSHTPSREAVNLNVRAAFIHVIGDMVQSVGVFIAALLIYFRPDWAIADPICTFIFSVIVLFTTFNIMKDALLVLMEGTPSYMQYSEVLQTFLQIEGVERVHNLRIWALSINKTALSVHLAIAPGADAKRILEEATTLVHNRYHFFETTIQIEEYTPQMDDCQQCTVPKV